MTTPSEIHDSAKCDAANGQPCPMCIAAIEHETRNVVKRVQIEILDERTFDDDWELAPLSMTRTTEKECALYWYQMGQRAKEREMLVLQNADYREMLRVGRERVER